MIGFSYAFFRNMNRLFNILCSGIGITAIISIIGLLSPQYPINPNLDENEKKKRYHINDIMYKTRVGLSIFSLIFVIVLGFFSYKGTFNIEDVFNGNYKYVGQTLNGKAEGFGRKYTNSDALLYEGDFAANIYNGKGALYNVIPLTDGTERSLIFHEGRFVNGLIEGYGFSYYNENIDLNRLYPRLKSEGNFKNGVLSDYGIFFYYSIDNTSKSTFLSSVYEGDWEDGYQNGKGELSFFNADGELISRYRGDFKNGQQSGIGVWAYHDDTNGETIYHGNVENGSFVSPGVFYNSEGKEYKILNEDNRDINVLITEYPFPNEDIWEKKTWYREWNYYYYPHLKDEREEEYLDRIKNNKK